MAWYLRDQVNSDRVLKKLATHVLCYVNSWMTVDEPGTSELDQLLNHPMEGKHGITGDGNSFLFKLLSLVRQQSSRSSQNTPRDNRCFNSKDSNLKRNEFPSPVIPCFPSIE